MARYSFVSKCGKHRLAAELLLSPQHSPYPLNSRDVQTSPPEGHMQLTPVGCIKQKKLNSLNK